MTRVAELEAANAALKQLLLRWMQFYNLSSTEGATVADMDALRQESHAATNAPARKIVDEGMEQDARRYRWLREKRMREWGESEPSLAYPTWTGHIAWWTRNAADAALAKEIDK